MTTHFQKRELIRLARNGHIRKLRELLEKELDINFVQRKTGMSPLMTAANAGQPAAVELFLQHGAAPNLRADDNASALHWACRCGNLQIVDMLLEAGADVNVRRSTDRNDEGPTPIHMALSNQQCESRNEIVRKLIDAGASLDIEFLGRTVLQYAEWRDCEEIADHIRQLGVRR